MPGLPPSAAGLSRVVIVTGILIAINAETVDKLANMGH